MSSSHRGQGAVNSASLITKAIGDTLQHNAGLEPRDHWHKSIRTITAKVCQKCQSHKWSESYVGVNYHAMPGKRSWSALVLTCSTKAFNAVDMPSQRSLHFFLALHRASGDGDRLTKLREIGIRDILRCRNNMSIYETNRLNRKTIQNSEIESQGVSSHHKDSENHIKSSLSSVLPSVQRL